MVLNTEWAQVEVIDLINDGSGLAFGIIGGRSTGVVVKTILPGGVADRDGRLQSGDHILQIGDVNIRGFGSEQVAAVLRQCGVHVRMVVARPVESTSSDYQTLASHAPIVPTKLLGDLDELDRHLMENGYSETFKYNTPESYQSEYRYSPQQPDISLHSLSGIVDVVRDPLPIGTAPVPPTSTPVIEVEFLPLDMALHGSALPETESFSVDLKKDELGLGITVAGYVCEKEEISGIFVKSIVEGSAADQSKQIKVNDRIIEVDGVSLIDQTNHQAVQMLRHTGPVVNLKLERFLRGPKYEQLQQAIRANELKDSSPPLSPSLISLPKIPISLLDTSTLVDPEGESRTSVDFDSTVFLENNTINDVEIVINEKCSSIDKQKYHDASKNKWRDILDSDVEIAVGELTKDANGGLGISLEGTVDVEDGHEVRPHHYIRSILPEGPVGKNTILQSGDELLEVNNTRLLGLNHVEVVSILKKLPQDVVLVCARNGCDPLQRRIIDTSQDRNAFASRNILGGSLETLIPFNDKMVKAKSESSLDSTSTSGTYHDSQLSNNCSKSKSLEMAVGFAMWNDEPQYVELMKEDKGLGFSILDYQDPLNPQEVVIVIRSLVPGGAAQRDGRLIPGDKLVSVNGVSLEKTTLDRAVQVLKSAPKGVVRIGVLKPMSSHDTLSHSSQVSSLSFQECVSDNDDHTCLDDYHECIEEYQECLEVVHICIDEEGTSFACTPSESCENIRNVDNSGNIIGGSDNPSECINSVLPLSTINNDLSRINNNQDCSDARDFTSIIDSIYNTAIYTPLNNVKSSAVFNFDNNESFSNKDTKVEEVPSEGEHLEKHISDKTAMDEHNILDNTFIVEEHPNLSTKKSSDPDLKSYDTDINSFGADQFFLVDYIDDDAAEDRATPVMDFINVEQVSSKPSTPFRKCLPEYYNDYKDCIEQYQKYNEEQLLLEALADDKSFIDIEEKPLINFEIEEKSLESSELFADVIVTLKSKSAPGSLCRSHFEEDDWDLTKLIFDKNRRKSEFAPGHQPESVDSGGGAGGGEDVVSMTVARGPEASCSCPGSRASSADLSMLEKHWGEARLVNVYREPNASLGISIVGGKVDLCQSGATSESLLGIFVKNVVSDSPAGHTGQFKTGDRILEVGGTNLRQASHEKAVEAIRNSANPVTFLVQSLIPWPSENELNTEENNKPEVSPCELPLEINTTSKNKLESPSTESKASQDVLTTQDNKLASPEIIPKSTESVLPINDVESNLSIEQKVEPPANEKQEVNALTPMKKPVVDSSSESDDDEDEEDTRNLEGKTYSEKGEEIDRASAAAVKRSKEEIAADPDDEDDFGYTNNKVKKKYATLGHTVLMVQLERGGQGLGLSLAGHRDRNCMAVFVCGLNPTGAAFRTGGIQVGDEILEVNGIVLHGRCHLNASAIIKGLSGPIFKVIILRRKTALEDIAVKPITQFPVSLEEETPEEKYANYPNVRTVSIKKGTHSLGIMIIEGRHAEVGQGIFISDIQDGSAAEKAGLDIGEMILAVNNDTLLGASYDSAAGLLKRTEGVVTLVLSNPNKKAPSPIPALEITPSVNDDKSTHVTPKRSTPTPNLRTSAPPSRPTTPIAEPVADPLTCEILPGKEVVIEMPTDNKNLGLAFVGGKDTPIAGGIVVLEVFPDGAAGKDGRLKPGDQLIEVNGVSLLDISNINASAVIRQILPKFKMTVFRPEKIDLTTIDVELTKKAGKGLGLSVIAPKNGTGVYISEILSGSCADVDGRLMKGDIVISVNDQKVDAMSSELVAALLKTVAGRVTLKLNRHKPQIR